MNSGAQVALGALIGVAALVGFAAVLVPVLRQRGTTPGAQNALGLIETMIVMAALGAAAASIVGAVSLLAADHPLQRGIPASVIDPLCVAACLMMLLGVLARTPGNSALDLLQNSMPRLVAAAVALCAGFLSIFFHSTIGWMGSSAGAVALLLVSAGAYEVLHSRFSASSTRRTILKHDASTESTGEAGARLTRCR